jgi:hypothetical protein|nr:MAG: hypothetical protein [Bacteriophage sp.]
MAPPPFAPSVAEPPGGRDNEGTTKDKNLTYAKEKNTLTEHKILQKALIFAHNERIIKTVKDTNTQQHGGKKS